MGHLIDDEAAKIVASDRPEPLQRRSDRARLERRTSRRSTGETSSSIWAAITALQVGQQFDIVRLKSLIDPTTHATLHVSENVGTLQIDTVSQNASVGHVVSGTAAVRLTVTSQP